MLAWLASRLLVPGRGATRAQPKVYGRVDRALREERGIVRAGEPLEVWLWVGAGLPPLLAYPDKKLASVVEEQISGKTSSSSNMLCSSVMRAATTAGPGWFRFSADKRWLHRFTQTRRSCSLRAT